MLSDHYFGDVEAIDEGRNHPEYFHSTFILPSSLSISSLNNKNKFIVVGRKGSGKTAVQFHLSRELEPKGFLTHFFSFYNDLKPKDYNDAAATQKIDLLGIVNSKNIFLNYDFRDIWERTFLIKIAEEIRDSGRDSKFVSFTLGNRSKLSSIFDGILKSTKIAFTAEMGLISGELGLDLSTLKSGEIAISDFVSLSRELLVKHHSLFRFYLFVDELVFSKLDAFDDEVRVRAAMVRDIFRSARNLNNFFVEKDLDFHIVCSVRPEIRDPINDLDAEIGKIFDGKSVDLNWNLSDGEDSLIFNILKQKIIHSRWPKDINFDGFIANKVSFGNHTAKLSDFISTNTWSRPRDIVQFLNSIATKNPNSPVMGVDEIKKSLNEFSRRSMMEILEEVSVRHGPKIGSTLRKAITKREYKTFQDFYDLVIVKFSDVDKEDLIIDLFNFGVVGNFDDSFSKRRFYWAHRSEEFLSRDRGVLVHPGLWNYFNVR